MFSHPLRQREKDHLEHLSVQVRWEKEERELDTILSLMLPPSVIATLKSGGAAEMRFAREYRDVSILFGARAFPYSNP